MGTASSTQRVKELGSNGENIHWRIKNPEEGEKNTEKEERPQILQYPPFSLNKE